jgi:hypothetical protein
MFYVLRTFVYPLILTKKQHWGAMLFFVAYATKTTVLRVPTESIDRLLPTNGPVVSYLEMIVLVCVILLSLNFKSKYVFCKLEMRREVLLRRKVNERQYSVLSWVSSNAKRLSSEAVPALLKRFISLGYKQDDLFCVLQYIRDIAPVIIHVHMDRLIDFFLKDSRYRNLFEVGKGNGSNNQTVRASWEDDIFNRGYKDAKPPERVKYGVLNVCADPAGIASCRQYGDSYFLLRNECVRLRTTFADQGDFYIYLSFFSLA